MRLEGKTAIITGCNRGLGKAIVTAFASEGAITVMVGFTIPLDGDSVTKERLLPKKRRSCSHIVFLL